MDECRKRIVYVDDIQFGLMSLKSRLKDRYEIFPAQSAEKMFEILQKIQPDLILLDVNMPEVDGYQAIQQLKKSRLFSLPLRKINRAYSRV
jgi:putative two-component system response regulator